MPMTPPASEDHFRTLFEYAPISLWEEDYGGIRRLFDELRSDGVRSLEDHLRENPGFVDRCMEKIAVLEVNRRTLDTFKAASREELLSNLGKVFRDGMRHHLRSELLALWDGELAWSGEGTNYTLMGEPLEVLLHWQVLPGFEESWERVLVSVEDISDRKQAERRLRDLFEASPISLWEEDYRAIKVYLDGLRAQGVTDLGEYLRLHPDAVSHCLGLIAVLNVNQKTLDLFGAGSKDELLANLDKLFRDRMETHFAGELVDLWNGKLAYEREGINYSLNGEPFNVHLDFRVMPGHEQDFSWVLVAIQDINARKKAEDYLRYLGTHDVLTGLFNRAFFEESLTQLDNEHPEMLSVIIADLDNLKAVNDQLGHLAGDKLIRRAAEVLTASFDEGQVVARVGGDEFAVFLPGTDEAGAEAALGHIQALVEMNNKYYREPELSLSLGAATSKTGIPLEKVINLADDAMYQFKAQRHKRRRDDRK